MLQGLVAFVGVLVVLLLIGGVCFYRKYKTLKFKYSKLSEEEGGGEIEMHQITNWIAKLLYF